MAPKSKKQFEEMREEKRELIKAAALKLFSEKGFHSVSIRDISRSANIAQGLMYNYFESKENLLVNILEDFMKTAGALINPVDDDEITSEEMNSYFDLLIESMKTRRDYWIVIFQLTMQKDVTSLIFSKKSTQEIFGRFMHLVVRYFEERFENPQEELLLFRSVIKGLSLILVLTPEMCSDELTDTFKIRLKKMFVKPKLINPGNKAD
jgi:AcrR family transcriptional regulator